MTCDDLGRFCVSAPSGDLTGASVTRFPAADPSKVEQFKTGYSGSGLGIDSRGNVWVTNRFGNSDQGKATYDKALETLRGGGNYDEVLTRAM
jgi:hypothetical protein